jgi:methyltransferase
MPAHVLISVAALALVVATMLGELRHSRRNEQILRARGAIEPPDPVYATMQWAYPVVFIAMALEGAIAGGEPGAATLAGLAVFTLGKLIKYWAIATLGVRWTYRVLVLPDVPLVDGGPYRFVRHPNYVGVIGELVGMALVTGARWTGVAGTLFFGWLLWRRIRAEEKALARPRESGLRNRGWSSGQ